MGHFLYNLIWTWTPNFSSFWSFSCSLWTAFTLLLWFKKYPQNPQNSAPAKWNSSQSKAWWKTGTREVVWSLFGPRLEQLQSHRNFSRNKSRAQKYHFSSLLYSVRCTCQKTVRRGRNNDCWIKPNSSGSVPNMRLKEKKPPMDNQR